MFPANEVNETNVLRNPSRFKVDFARTTAYQHSAIPYIQNMLNKYFKLT